MPVILNCATYDGVIGLGLAVREGATASWLRFPIDQAIG